ncbi:MAG: hypothetical protein JXK16_03060 [Thiotrichales bacterium]|nr:hypothetical protein [Thiotrichales bacterium]
MKRRQFNTEREKAFIGLMMSMPTQERQKELLLCDLNSLAKAMTDYSNVKIETFAEALEPPYRQEFIKTVKMHKGEIPFPTQKVNRRKIQKQHYTKAVLAASILILLIFLLDWLMP